MSGGTKRAGRELKNNGNRAGLKEEMQARCGGRAD